MQGIYGNGGIFIGLQSFALCFHVLPTYKHTLKTWRDEEEQERGDGTQLRDLSILDSLTNVQGRQ